MFQLIARARAKAAPAASLDHHRADAAAERVDAREPSLHVAEHEGRSASPARDPQALDHGARAKYGDSGIMPPTM